MQARIENVFRVSPDVFWDRLFFDPEYNERLYQELGFESYEVLGISELGDGRVRRSLRAEPPLRVPDLLKRRIKSALFYTEDGVFDRAARVWQFTSVSSIAPEAAKIAGTIRSEPHAEGMLHVLELDVRVSAFGIGGLIERVIERNARESYGTTARFTNEFVAEKRLAFQS